MEVMRTDPEHKESLFSVIVVIISLLLLSTWPLVDFVELLYESSIAVKVMLLYPNIITEMMRSTKVLQLHYICDDTQYNSTPSCVMLLV